MLPFSCKDHIVIIFFLTIRQKMQSIVFIIVRLRNGSLESLFLNKMRVSFVFYSLSNLTSSDTSNTWHKCCPLPDKFLSKHLKSPEPRQVARLTWQWGSMTGLPRVPWKHTQASLPRKQRLPDLSYNSSLGRNFGLDGNKSLAAFHKFGDTDKQVAPYEFKVT